MYRDMSLTLRILSFVLFFVLIFTISPAGAQQISPLPGNTRIGQNPGMVFIDVCYAAGPWHQGGSRAGAFLTDLTADGYPKSGMATCGIDASSCPAGPYLFYGEGNFTVA